MQFYKGSREDSIGNSQPVFGSQTDLSLSERQSGSISRKEEGQSG